MDDAPVETARIMTSLKRLMRSRAVTYSELGKRVGLSEASIKRIFSRSTLTLARLDQICQALDTTIQEVTRLAADHSVEPAETLSLKQEAALAADSNLLACFYLVASGRDGREIAEGLRARAYATSAIKWRREGPIANLYARQVREEFLQSPFTGPIDALHFRSSE